MKTHWEFFQKRKEPQIKEQYRLAIEYYKTVGKPVGKLPGESWSDYIARVSKPVP